MTETMAAAIAGGVSAGVVLALRIGGSVWQKVQQRINGGADAAGVCSAHAGMVAMFEQLFTELRANNTTTQNAQRAAIVVTGSQGERIASLEAATSTTANGIREMRVSLRDIEALLRDAKGST